MFGIRLLTKRLPLVFGLAIGFFGVLLLGVFSVPETPARVPVPARKKDKYDRAIDRGLEWLALHQAQDGHWSLHAFNKDAREKLLPEGKIFVCDCEAGVKIHNDIAATAFGVLPFLAAGHTRKSSDKKPDYSKIVDAGLKYLLAKQNKDGSFDKDMYANGLASRVLCDAYGLTKDKTLKGPAQKALDFIADAQDPTGGGWRYEPRQPGDLSVTGWQYIALKRGQQAGLNAPKKTLELAEKFLDSCESEKKGGYSYTPGGRETMSMTAVGLLCRQYSLVNPRNPSLVHGVVRIKNHYPDKLDNIYYLYYASQVMFHMRGEIWRYWDTGVDSDDRKVHRGIGDCLLAGQDKGDKPKHQHQSGSWGGSPGGRIMATSLSLLILEQRNHKSFYR